jgi:DNA-binding response OmpR family regulator
MSAKPRVLIADDDGSIRDLIRIYLQIAGYEVAVARDGAEALDHARSARPDAMVLDINMPHIDGFAVLQKLSELTPSHPPVPVLVLTARHAVADVRRAIELGARDFLAKPFTEVQLIARVARLLRIPPQVIEPGKVAV